MYTKSHQSTSTQKGISSLPTVSSDIARYNRNTKAQIVQFSLFTRYFLASSAPES